MVSLYVLYMMNIIHVYIMYILLYTYMYCVGSIFQEKSLDCESDPFDSLSKELHDQVENDGPMVRQDETCFLQDVGWVSLPDSGRKV